MSAEALELRARAKKAFDTSKLLCTSDLDAAASRAYYAVFHAVSALFALEALGIFGTILLLRRVDILSFVARRKPLKPTDILTMAAE